MKVAKTFNQQKQLLRQEWKLVKCGFKTLEEVKEPYQTLLKKYYPV